MTAAIDHGATDLALLEETIGEMLATTVERFPDREALVVPHQGIRQTWTEFAATVDQVAKGLMARGVGKGDRVAMWSPNFAEWVYIQYATAAIGAIQVNINPAYRTSELEYALRQSGCRMLVTRTEYLTSDVPGHGRSGPSAAARSGRRRLFRHRRLGCPARRRRIGLRRGSGCSGGVARPERPDQHPVHIGNHRLPEGCHPESSKHPQRCVARRCRRVATTRRTGSVSRCPSTTASAW